MLKQLKKIMNEKGLSQGEIEAKVAAKLKQLSDLISKEGNIFYQKVLEGEITPEQAASELTQILNRQFEVKQ